VKRSYVFLVAAVAIAATLVAVAARPRRAAPEAAVVAAAPGADVAIALAIEGGLAAPAATSAPKGARVTLAAENRDAAPRRVALLGYEGRFAPVTIEPGRSVLVRFTADRPGGDFAWMIDGRPAGRFSVTGSHLVEGHR
jgi:hypothetical protein